LVQGRLDHLEGTRVVGGVELILDAPENREEPVDALRSFWPVSLYFSRVAASIVDSSIAS